MSNPKPVEGAREALGPEFAKWWASVRSDYKSHESETVARAAWVIAWNVGRAAKEQADGQSSTGTTGGGE